MSATELRQAAEKCVTHNTDREWALSDLLAELADTWDELNQPNVIGDVNNDPTMQRALDLARLINGGPK